MEDRYIKGTPPMAMLPAKNYIFKMNGGYIEIKIPMKGNYHDLDPEFFPEDAGEFNIFDEDTKTLHLHTITKVIFAVKKYPDMKFNQFFIPHAFTFEEESVILTGQIMDMMVIKPKVDEV